MEEEYRFAAHGGDDVTTGILKQTLAEGRKFGIGMGLISQRPGKLDPDVLSQCLTQCIMRIVNEADQKSVPTAGDGAGRHPLGHPPPLSRGASRLARSAPHTPPVTRARTRL